MVERSAATRIKNCNCVKKTNHATGLHAAPGSSATFSHKLCIDLSGKVKSFLNPESQPILPSTRPGIEMGSSILGSSLATEF